MASPPLLAAAATLRPPSSPTGARAGRGRTRRGKGDRARGAAAPAARGDEADARALIGRATRLEEDARAATSRAHRHLDAWLEATVAAYSQPELAPAPRRSPAHVRHSLAGPSAAPPARGRRWRRRRQQRQPGIDTSAMGAAGAGTPAADADASGDEASPPGQDSSDVDGERAAGGAPVSDDAARGADSGDATRAGAVDDVSAVLRGGGAGACCAICLESVTVAGRAWRRWVSLPVRASPFEGLTLFRARSPSRSSARVATYFIRHACGNGSSGTCAAPCAAPTPRGRIPTTAPPRFRK